MNEIVKQHNDLIDLPLRKFNSSEIDILLAICYKCQNENTQKITLNFNQIKELSHFKGKDKKELIHSIEETNRKLLQLNFKIGNDVDFIQFVLFPTFEVKGTEETLTVQVHEKFAYLLNNLTENYTSLELRESSSLKSAYAKSIYKKLRKYRDTGVWRVSNEDFRTYLDIPKAYKTSDINKRVIYPSVEELIYFFPGLECKPYYDKSKKGRGRPPIAGYTFSFTPQPHKEKGSPTPKQIAEKTGWTATGKFCPRCGEQMYSSLRENENGTYTMYGHPDFKTGNCDFTTFDMADLVDKHQLEETVPKTEEQKENKKKVSDLLKGLFD